MIPQKLDESPFEHTERNNGKSTDGLMARLAHHRGSDAWRETVTRHVPESGLPRALPCRLGSPPSTSRPTRPFSI
jgi:hypothetical protein